VSQIIPRDTVMSIVRKRNERLDLYAEAHASISAASEALARAWDARMSPSEHAFNYATKREEAEFLGALKVPDRDGYLTTARKITDIDVWSRIVKMTELEKLMDKTAKDQLRQELATDPPEVTEENVLATVEKFAGEAGMIFRRGIATMFSKLDRRFRSHDGWKVGSRVVLTHVFDTFGSWCYRGNERDTISDIERAFYVLDGKPVPPSYAGLVEAVDAARKGNGLSPVAASVETEFFRCHTFKNGNAHIWFKRDDLLERVNKLLGEYYANPIPEEREADERDQTFAAKTMPAKRDGFFPTPPEAAARLIEQASLYRRQDAPILRVLEPSAGTGNLASLAVAKGATVDCIEIQPGLAAGLRQSGRFAKVLCADFLGIQPAPTPIYDRVVMNPPFDRERDIDHVMHALKFLKPDGRLVAIMSAGTEFRETKKAIAFRALMSRLKADWRDLPPGSFAASGTYCNTVILTVNINGCEPY